MNGNLGAVQADALGAGRRPDAAGRCSRPALSSSSTRDPVAASPPAGRAALRKAPRGAPRGCDASLRRSAGCPRSAAPARLAVVAVDDHDVAGLDPRVSTPRRGRPPGCRGRGRRSRHGRSASPPPAPGPEPPAVVVQQLGRAHRARDQDELVGQIGRGGGRRLPGQMLQQPVGEVVEIVQPLAQIGIGDLHHAARGVVAAPSAPRPRR